MPPVAARWRDAATGVYTVAELRTRGKRGTAHVRVVLVAESTFDTTASADAAWATVTARHANANGAPSLEGVAARELMLNEIVKPAGKYGCLWRVPRRASTDASSSGSGDDDDDDDDGEESAIGGGGDGDESLLESTIHPSTPEQQLRQLLDEVTSTRVFDTDAPMVMSVPLEACGHPFTSLLSGAHDLGTQHPVLAMPTSDDDIFRMSGSASPTPSITSLDDMLISPVGDELSDEVLAELAESDFDSMFFE
jgi:hypothetical protein